MDKIKVIKVLKYKDCPVYIRALDIRFEFLVIYKNKLYSQYFVIKPKWFRVKYTKGQLENIVKLVYIAACKTIDELKK